jgi:DNA invertase Pin-like site-specific DNA recombinase
MNANGLRLVAPARKSRKGDESSQFDRQKARNAERAERDGHVIVHTTHDVVSSQTMPWDRKELKEWMIDPNKVALYDGILVETDRLARCDDKGWHVIESWCYDHDKKIITTEGVQFPPRDDSDRYQWIGLKRRARTYWEDVRDKHAQTRELIKANGGAIGRAPFGYAITGEKLHKTFVIDPVWGSVAREAFQRIADGHTATSVALWLTEQTGGMWRVKRVTDMIGRRTYLGERDGHSFDALVTQELWDSANAALATRSFKHKETGGRRTEHAYSGLIFCECGAQLYRHQSERGSEKYRCGRGRRGDLTETRCEYGAPLFAEINDKINAVMSKWAAAEWVTVTTGGDHGKQMELQRIQSEMSSAMAKKDMIAVTKLAAEYAEVDARESEPVKVQHLQTGRVLGDVWRDGDLADRRALLGRTLAHRLTIKMVDGEWKPVMMPMPSDVPA